jgi:dipeptide/tripeptide permease
MVKELVEPERLSATSVSPDPKAPIPRQIRYIIGNEGCERFSFYGMRNILTVFLVSSLLLYLPESERARGAKDVFHTFVIGVYFFPLLGGWLADRFFGKYNTIFWLSLVYCVGQACLAMFVTNRTGFYIGLGLIALARAASNRVSLHLSATSSTRLTSTAPRWCSRRFTGSSTLARSSRRY